MKYEFTVRVYWEDTDAGGVVYHSKYANYFERARSEWLLSRGISQKAMSTDVGGKMVVVSLKMRFLKPAVLEDQLVVKCLVSKCLKSSIHLDQEIVNKDNGELLVEAQVVIAWVSNSNFRPTRIPETIRTIFE